jgi:transcriptional regulator with XRE-family HTH domain
MMLPHLASRSDRVPSVPQFRAARALLAWSQDELAARADIGRATVGDFERGARTPIRLSIRAMRQTLEAAGIRFVWSDDGTEGVVLLGGPGTSAIADDSDRVTSVSSDKLA